MKTKKPIKMIFSHMAMLTALPMETPVFDSQTSNTYFRQTISPQFIKRSLIWHMWCLLLGIAFLWFYVLVMNGTINMTSSRRSPHVIGIGSAFMIVYCIAGLVWTWLIRRCQYRIDILSTGEVTLNDKPLPTAELIQSKVAIYDACRLGNKSRGVEALILTSKNKHYILYAHDQREKIERIAQRLSIRVRSFDDTIHVYGVL